MERKKEDNLIYLFRKKPSQLLAVLTAVCMLAAMFPPVGFAANQTRQIITLADGGDLRAAVENANSGDTIQLSGTGYVNAAEGDKPWIIDKNITIQGGTLNLRAGGILLGADAVFAGVTLDFTSNVRNAIMANGHSLTLDNVKASNVSVNLFCGGLIPAGYENFTVPSSGPAGEIIVRGATNLQADTKFGSGNIFAGNLCMGGMDAVHNGASDNGPANVFSGNAVINIEGSASGTSLGEIYACGAQQRIPVGASSGKMTVPNSDDYTVSGTVTVTGDIPHVDGAGSRATDVRYSGSGNAANRVFSRISSLSVENGYLILDAGTSFRTQDAPLSAASGAKLDIQNLGAFPVGSFSGGTLIMGANQTLTINGEVSGETAVAIGGTRPSGDIVVSTGSPVKGHTYIQAPNSTENSFHLLPPAAQLDMTLVRDASGNWTVPDDSTGGNSDLVKDFSFDTTAITAAPGEEVEFPLTVEGTTSAPVYLDYIPLTINVKGYPTNRTEVEIEGETCYKYASRGNYVTMEIIANSLYVTSDKEWGAAESPYPIEIVLPKEYRASGTILRTSATLTVEGASQPGHTHSWDTAWTSDSDYHWHNCTAAGCTVNDNSQKDGYAAHTPSDWIIDRPATETQEGSQYKACTVCGYETDREVIPATGTTQPGHTHSWDTAWTSDPDYHWHNCTAAGCTVNDNSQKDGYAAHTASGWIIDRPATATQDGTRHKACTVCGYRMASETIPATGTPQPEHTHKWDASWSSNSSHHWHNCTAAGCTVSDNSQKNGYAAHTPGDWIIDQPATATQDGKRHKECTVCGYKTASETIPATGTPQPEHTHKWDTSWSSNSSHHWHNCTAADCTVSDNSQKNGYAAHTAGDWIIDRPATATQDGTRHKECTVCGYRMASETIPATGTPHVHNWSASWTSDAAHHWHNCTAADCTVSDNSQKSGYAAHTASGWIIDRPASFTQDGTRHKECTVCGYRMAQETIPPTGGGSSGGGSSGGGSSGGSGSSSSSGSGGNTSTTEKHPDGSTTTTVTNQTSGVVTETTKHTDGSIKVVETQKDGTVTSTEMAADGGTVKTVEKADGSTHTSIQQSDGTAAEIAVDASGSIQASVTLPAAASGTVTLPVPKMPVGKDSSSAVTVHTGSGSPVKVRIPAENPSFGTVAVIVHKDGTETVVKTSVPTADSVTAELPDGAAVKLVDNRKIFSDTGRHWADNAIDFVSARGLFSGETAAEFKPEGAMTRAMLMTVLARLDGAAGIEDGPAWYEKGIAWAALRGISDGTNPESRITREQLVTMLHRYAGSPSATNKELYFSDAGAVSDYALNAVRWGVEKGLLGGHDNGLLAPGGQATRAQAAEILMRYIQLLHQ